MSRLVSWIVLVASVSACRERRAEVRPDPTPSVVKAPAPVEGVLLHTCAPFDGAAYALIVGGSCASTTMTDGLRVTVYRNLPKAAGTKAEWKLGTNIDNGSASRFVAGKYVGDLYGTVSLEHAADGSWSAEWSLRDGKGANIEQRLKLTECPGTPMCG